MWGGAMGLWWISIHGEVGVLRGSGRIGVGGEMGSRGSGWNVSEGEGGKKKTRSVTYNALQIIKRIPIGLWGKWGESEYVRIKYLTYA